MQKSREATLATLQHSRTEQKLNANKNLDCHVKYNIQRHMLSEMNMLVLFSTKSTKSINRHCKYHINYKWHEVENSYCQLSTHSAQVVWRIWTGLRLHKQPDWRLQQRIEEALRVSQTTVHSNYYLKAWSDWSDEISANGNLRAITSLRTLAHIHKNIQRFQLSPNRVDNPPFQTNRFSPQQIKMHRAKFQNRQSKECSNRNAEARLQK